MPFQGPVPGADVRQPPDPPPERDRWNRSLALRDRLDVVVELVDANLDFVLPDASTGTVCRLREVLSGSQRETFVAAGRRAAASGAVELVHLDKLRIGLFALRSEWDGGLMLVFAEPADVGRDTERQREWWWTANALSQSFSPQRTAAGVRAARDLRDSARLRCLLNRAVASGSQRDAVQAFVDALAVYSDMDVRAYVGDLSGRFWLEAGPYAADPRAAPGSIATEALTFRDASNVWLTEADAASLGFRSAGRLLMARLTVRQAAPRSLAVLRASARDEARLLVFGQMLASALESAAEVEASRLVWALSEALLAPGAAGHRADAAVRELADRTGASIEWTIQRADGVPVLRSGDSVSSANEAGTDDIPVEQTFRLRVNGGYEGVLVMRRPDSRPLTTREQSLGRVAASLLRDWAGSALKSRELAGERRAAASGSDEPTASRDAEKGPVSLLLICPPAAAPEAGVGQRWTAEIGKQLRPSDVAGPLLSGEIAVYLPHTSAYQAEAVVRRLRRSFRESTELAPLDSAPIGVASRLAASTAGAPLVRLARERAAAAAGARP